MRHTVFICILLLLLANSLYPAWLDNIPNQLKQPDGTTIDVFYSGDEHHNWIHDKDHYTMIRDEKTGYVCWATAKDGDLVSTGYPVHLHTSQSLGLTPRENISEDIYLQKRRSIDDLRENSPTRSPTLGTINELVVFIRFSDDSEFTQLVSHYNAMFNDTGTDVNSLKQYYFDASYGQLTVNSPFFPTQTGSTIISVRDTHPRSYYQPYNAITNPNGYMDYERGDREAGLLVRAIQSIINQIPPTLNIDGDNDQFVDNVNFVIKGVEGDWATLLWPHRSWLGYYATVTINGKYVSDYNFNIENHMDVSGVSVLAHEFGHSLGAPDYYRYSYDATPVWYWDLMGQNTNPPQSMSAYTKWHYMRWVDAIPTALTDGYYTLYPNTISQWEHSLSIPSPYSSTEYFIVEYRNTQTGLIDSVIPGSGLVVWRVNRDAGWGNSEGPPDELYVYRPNGTPNFDGSPLMAFFSAQSGRTAINDYSNPQSFLSNGQLGGLNISNIGYADESITFYVNVSNSQQPPVFEIDPPSFDFGSISLGQSSTTQRFTVTNVSNATVVVSSVAVTGLNAASFDLVVTCLPWEIFPSESWDFTVTFTPTSTGEKPAYVSFTSTDIGLPQYINITGAGVGSGFTLPYTQNFNSVINLFDNEWGGYLNIYSGIYANSGVNGTNALAMSVLSASPTINVSTPFINNITPETTLSFAYRIVDSLTSNLTGTTLSASDKVYIEVYATSGGGTFETIYEINSQNHAISADFTTLVIPLSDYYASLDISIRFRVVWSTGRWYFVLDDVAVYDPTSEYDDMVSPTRTALVTNYPNPFNPETTISFSLAHPERVRLDIYNVRGQLVQSLVNSVYDAGVHTAVWNGKDNLGRSVSSGVYFYTMTTAEYTSVRKMLLLK